MGRCPTQSKAILHCRPIWQSTQVHPGWRWLQPAIGPHRMVILDRPPHTQRPNRPSRHRAPLTLSIIRSSQLESDSRYEPQLPQTTKNGHSTCPITCSFCPPISVSPQSGPVTPTPSAAAKTTHGPIVHARRDSAPSLSDNLPRNRRRLSQQRYQQE